MREIYFDNCATTRVDEAAAKTALDLMLNTYGNPSSLHRKGIEAQLLLDAARSRTAAALGCEPEEVVFTSGGTESNNIAIFGGVKAKARSGRTLVSTAWEHSSVLEPLRELERRGYVLKLVSPDSGGHIDIEKIAGAVDSDTVFVSCMMVNSEVGGITDIAGLVKLVRRKNSGALIHCDAVQGFGKLAFSAKSLGVDMLSASGHKIHAPKGAGVLFLKKTARVTPVIYGGGQEKGVRPGTEPMPLIAALGAAAETASSGLKENLAHISALHEYFVNKAYTADGMCINSPPDSTPYICNVSIPGYRSEIMLHYLAGRGIFVSSGSACSSGKPSHVLAAMRLPRDISDSAIRVSFSKYNEIREIDEFFKAVSDGMREISV